MVFPTDWVTNKENASTIVVINSVTPINETGSLRIGITEQLQERVSLQNNTYTNGLTAGRMRSKFRVDMYESLDFSGFGFTFMMNEPTLFSPTSEGYGVLFILDPAYPTSLAEIDIIKYTSGLPVAPTILDSTTNFVNPGFSTFVMEVDWVFSLSVLGGTLITVRFDDSDDFGELSPVLQFTDTSSPLTTTTTEGLAVNGNVSGFSLNEMEIGWDDTTINELV